MKKREKRVAYILRAGMTVLTIILIILFFGIMSLVSDLQGTARVVNYAGLVRGETQRVIKLEMSKKPDDEMIATVECLPSLRRLGKTFWQNPDFTEHCLEMVLLQLWQAFSADRPIPPTEKIPAFWN